MTNGPDDTTPDELGEVSRRLIAGWEAADEGGQRTFGHRDRRPNKARFVSVYGLVSHVHRQGSVFLDLYQRDLVLEGLPLLRSMYEGALTAIWLAQNDEAVLAFVNKELASRKAIANTLAKARNDLLRTRAKDFPGLDEAPSDTESDNQARKFEALCNDLAPGGPDAYVLYRLLSRYSHASVHIAEAYIETNSARDEVVALRTEPIDMRDRLWLFLAAASLIWAGTAADYIDPARRRRSELRSAARQVGIPRDLHLTQDALNRTRRSEQKRRHAHRERRND